MMSWCKPAVSSQADVHREAWKSTHIAAWFQHSAYYEVCAVAFRFFTGFRKEPAESTFSPLRDTAKKLQVLHVILRAAGATQYQDRFFRTVEQRLLSQDISELHGCLRRSQFTRVRLRASGDVGILRCVSEVHWDGVAQCVARFVAWSLGAFRLLRRKQDHSLLPTPVAEQRRLTQSCFRRLTPHQLSLIAYAFTAHLAPGLYGI